MDIYRSANVLIREHGETAWLIAARRSDEMLERGNSVALLPVEPSLGGVSPMSKAAMTLRGKLCARIADDLQQILAKT